MTDSPTILECNSVWKVFGPGAKDFATHPGKTASAEDFARPGLIAGVRDATLKIRKGEIFIIMGLSGSGKSTLVRCMTGLHSLTDGEVLIDGVNLARIPERDLVALRRKKISMVFQDFALLPHLTVLGNIAFPLKVQGVSRREREETARQMIDLVGLGGREAISPMNFRAASSNGSASRAA
jgi:glycine betaine/proline transport system ATP-binding protein